MCFGKAASLSKGFCYFLSIAVFLSIALSSRHAKKYNLVMRGQELSPVLYSAHLKYDFLVQFLNLA